MPIHIGGRITQCKLHGLSPLACLNSKPAFTTSSDLILVIQMSMSLFPYLQNVENGIQIIELFGIKCIDMGKILRTLPAIE